MSAVRRGEGAVGWGEEADLKVRPPGGIHRGCVGALSDGLCKSLRFVKGFVGLAACNPFDSFAKSCRHWRIESIAFSLLPISPPLFPSVGNFLFSCREPLRLVSFGAFVRESISTPFEIILGVICFFTQPPDSGQWSSTTSASKQC